VKRLHVASTAKTSFQNLRHPLTAILDSRISGITP